MSEDELRAITDGEMRQAVGYWSGKLANQRQKAMAYYLGEAKLDLAPPEVDGRSAVVSPDVRNTIESMLPPLMVKFCGGDTVVEFEAQKPGDEPKAEQATDYINHLFYVRNPGERIAYNWMKDALLSKNGIVKVWWDTRTEETREEYVGLSDVELAQLMDDEEIEVTEQKAYEDEEDQEQRQEAIEQINGQMQQAMQAAEQNPQAAQAVQQMQARIQQIQTAPPKMLYDVVCKRSKEGGRIKVDNVPPEEFLISRNAKSIADATFVGHRVLRTASELKSMGYKDVDKLTSDDAAAALNMERIERLAWDDELAYLNTDTQLNLDDSQRKIWVTECYLRCDFDGDGIAELRKVVRAGNEILDNEVCDVAPFVSITPVPMPHKFFGLSVADLALEGQKIKTSILRGMLDNMYLQINGRYFAVDGQVNLDDLLTSRPGGVVRMKAPNMAGRLDQGMGDPQIGMGMMEYMTGYIEDSTGWSRASSGTDVNDLNSPISATQATIVTNKADMRTDLIARNFADGFRDLFRLMLKLCSQYQCKEDIVKLRGNWVPVNPRDWRNGFDTVLNVGLGTGSKDQQVRHLIMLLQQQQFGLQIGTASPSNVFQAQTELAKALGYKNGSKFFAEPKQGQGMPNPKAQAQQAETQAMVQIEQMKAQLKAQTDAQSKQAELQLERERMAMQAEVDRNRQEVEAQQQQAKMMMEKELAQFKIQAEMERDAMRAQMEQQTALAIARINAESRIDAAQLTAQTTLTTQQETASDSAVNQ
ncbi:hypothetical protein [Acidovorax sp.]|uniref:portal protein n=1 Tax=Acidovorax sp. TaxID=1872122 RepID=UPI0031E1EE1E